MDRCLKLLVEKGIFVVAKVCKENVGEVIEMLKIEDLKEIQKLMCNKLLKCAEKLIFFYLFCWKDNKKGKEKKKCEFVANLKSEDSEKLAEKVREYLGEEEEPLGPFIAINQQFYEIVMRVYRLFFNSSNPRSNNNSFFSFFSLPCNLTCKQENTLLLLDLGVIEYPPYECWNESIFSSRLELDSYERALKLRQRFEAERVRSQVYDEAKKSLVETVFVAIGGLMQQFEFQRDPLRSSQVYPNMHKCLEKVIEEVELPVPLPELSEYVQQTTQVLSLLSTDNIQERPSKRQKSEPRPSQSNSTTQSSPNNATLRKFTSQWVLCSILREAVAYFEKEKVYRLSVLLLRFLLSLPITEGYHARGKWWSRFVVNLEHMGNKRSALEVAEMGLKDESVRTGYRLSLQKKVLKLAVPPVSWKKRSFESLTNKKEEEICVAAERNSASKAGKKAGYSDGEGNSISVEEVALRFLAKEGWEGMHCENNLFRTLFGLLLWDCMFDCEIPFVFQNRYQRAPLDIHSDEFYSSRKEKIDSLLSQISIESEEQLKRRLANVYMEKHEISCHGVEWNLSLETLQEVSVCIGSQRLVKLLGIMARDYKGWSKGMPDLILWNLQEKQVKLVEVKGTNDKLSSHQRAWIDQLLFFDFHVQVCLVNQKKKKKK